MQYTAKGDRTEEITALKQMLLPVLNGLGFSLVELTVSRHRGSVQIRAVIYSSTGSISTDDCAKASRALLPRLDLFFAGQDFSLEVSSPGTDRQLKCGSEFVHFTGRGIKCYCTDISEWVEGTLVSVDENGIVLKTINDKKYENVRLAFDIIAKARLTQIKEVLS